MISDGLTRFLLETEITILLCPGGMGEFELNLAVVLWSKAYNGRVALVRSRRDVSQLRFTAKKAAIRRI
jgi:hypothetical protein